jgi:hypothetical protein
MKTVLEKTRVVKKTSLKARAWVNGVLMDVYVSGPNLNGSLAKIFTRSEDGRRISVVRGRTYLNDQNVLYFV